MYATVDDIKKSSKRVPNVISASASDLAIWMQEAADEIHRFCSQDFLFEPQTTKRVLLNGSSLVILPKILSGKISVKIDGGDSVPSTDLEHFAGEYLLRYRPLNVVSWRPHSKVPQFALVTGDWGFAPTLESLLISYANELKAKYNSHRLDTEAHNVADNTNVISGADATDLDSAIALLNEARGVVNAHLTDVVVHAVADSDNVTSVPATDITTAQVLALEIDTRWNDHIHDVESHVEAASEDDHTKLSVNNPLLPRPIKNTFIRLVKRIAIRDDEEDLYNRNSGYVSETTGDGYRYDQSNGTLRNLIQPEDFASLFEYQHHGTVVA